MPSKPAPVRLLVGLLGAVLIATPSLDKDRELALIFAIAGIIGLVTTAIARSSSWFAKLTESPMRRYPMSPMCS